MFKSSILLLLIAVCNVFCNLTFTCPKEDVCRSYLEVAVDMITKAKDNCPSFDKSIKNRQAIDCADIWKLGQKKNGVYKIYPINRVVEGKSINVYCDMQTDGGGWTIIQRRGIFNLPVDYFYKGWKYYKEGFGDLYKEFWLGNDNIFALTNQKHYSVRFDLKDVNQERRYALYDKFWIDDENHKYTLHISDYSGNAGESMLFMHNNKMFSTKDQLNDKHDCAVNHKGAWWYGMCQFVNLNGMNYRGKHKSFADGINWHAWKDFYESLEWTEIKIRPKNF